jgi:hypothetical protein
MALLTAQQLERFRPRIALLKGLADLAYYGDVHGDEEYEAERHERGYSFCDEGLLATDRATAERLAALMPRGTGTALQKDDPATRILKIMREGKTRSDLMILEARSEEDSLLERMFRSEAVRDMRRKEETAFYFSQQMYLLDLWDRRILGVKDAKGEWIEYDPQTARNLSADGKLYRFSKPGDSREAYIRADQGPLSQLEEGQFRERMDAFFREFDFGLPPDLFHSALEAPKSHVNALQAGKEKTPQTIDMEATNEGRFTARATPQRNGRS